MALREAEAVQPATGTDSKQALIASHRITMPHESSQHLQSATNNNDVTIPISIALESGLLLANILPICVVLRYKKSKERQATDELIVALSITDILSVLVPSPIGLVSSFNHHWYGGHRTCTFYQLTIVWFQLASMCLVTFMCIDRWLSLSGAMTYRKPSTGHKRTRIAILIIYLATLSISCLPLLGLAPNAFSTAGDSCISWLISKPKTPVQNVFFVVFLVVGYANLITAIVVNCTVILSLWKFQRKFGIKPSERVNGCAVQIDRRTVVEFSIMVLIVTAIFYLAWLPALTMITVQHIGVEVGQVVVVYSLLSTTLTGLLNPVIYGTFSKAYRQGYTRLIVASSKLLFGCPIAEEDVLADISSQARRMRSSASVNNSCAALIQNNGVTESRSGYSGVNTITPSSEHAVHDGEDGGDVIFTDASQVNPSNSGVDTTRRDTLDMHERTYFGELLTQRDNSFGDMNKEKFGSNLSLISEDSAEIEDDVSVESFNATRRNYNNRLVVRESMI